MASSKSRASAPSMVTKGRDRRSCRSAVDRKGISAGSQAVGAGSLPACLSAAALASARTLAGKSSGMRWLSLTRRSCTATSSSRPRAARAGLSCGAVQTSRRQGRALPDPEIVPARPPAHCRAWPDPYPGPYPRGEQAGDPRSSGRPAGRKHPPAPERRSAGPPAGRGLAPRRRAGPRHGRQAPVSRAGARAGFVPPDGGSPRIRRLPGRGTARRACLAGQGGRMFALSAGQGLPPCPHARRRPGPGDG